ncbi:MAG: hypothetical protein M1824_000014 [Vezdaea acicularis]|nr:MAG: hypothetical protein M1824_000014 [Vezdaea acicularis]
MNLPSLNFRGPGTPVDYDALMSTVNGSSLSSSSNFPSTINPLLNIIPQRYVPTQDWATRPPSPPRLIVPPPAYGYGAHGLSAQDGHAFTEQCLNLSKLDFLDVVTHHNFIECGKPGDWEYEWRRNAQRILPFLYIGPWGACKDRDFLRREGISMLLAVRDTLSAEARFMDGSKIANELGLRYESVDVAGNQELIHAFPATVKLMNDHLKDVYDQRRPKTLKDPNSNLPAKETFAIGKVLIYCESGNERSASLVAAYLMAMLDIDVPLAIRIVQGCRFCVCFSDAAKFMLQSYENILKARRDVEVAQQNESSVNGGNQNEGSLLPDGEVSLPASGRRQAFRGIKRGLEVEDENEGVGDIEMIDDQERFTEREGNAPFRDN